MTRPRWTRFASGLFAFVLIPAPIGCGESGSTEPAPGDPSVVAIVDGPPETSEAGAALAEELAVVVRDQNGVALAGVSVTWATTSGGAVAPTSSETDDQGIARATWTLGPSFGVQTASAVVAALEPALFSVTATLPASAVIEKIAGDAQTDSVAATLDSLGLEVRLADGRPVAGVPVVWSTLSGSIAGGSTDAAGHAHAEWILGGMAGEQTASAQVAGREAVIFTATALPGAAAVVVITPSPILFTTADRTEQLAATLQDRHGNMLPDVTAVEWSSSHPSLVQVDANGLATALATGIGATSIRAAAGGASGSVVADYRISSCVAVTSTPDRPAVGGIPTWQTPPVMMPILPADYSVYEGIAVDADDDGDEDIIGFAFNFPPDAPGGKVSVWRNDAGTFVDATNALLDPDSVVADHSRHFEIADFDGDGRNDIYVAQHGYDTEPFPGAYDLYFLSGATGFEEVGQSRVVPNHATGFSHASASGDIDCDGDIDLYAGVLGGGTDHIFLNDGGGTLMAADTLFPAETSGRTFTAAELCDIDRDGAPDLILGGWPASDIRSMLLYNDGLGSFSAAPESAVPSPIYTENHVVDINCVDFDRDGWNDLYVASTGAYELGHVEIWQNAGDRTFQRVELGLDEIPNGWVVRAAPVDFNADGWADIFAPLSGAAYGTRVYINNGGTGFTLAPFDGSDRGMFLVDADDDGRPDLYWPGGGEYQAELFLTR